MNYAGKPFEYKETAKRLKYIAAAAVFLLAAVILIIVKSAFASDQKITISSLEELQKIGTQADYPLDGQYTLANDLDGAELQEELIIAQIGTQNQPFTGSFDGQGHIIKNLQITEEEETAALEGNGYPLFLASENSIVNLTLEQVVLKEETGDNSASGKDQENTGKSADADVPEDNNDEEMKKAGGDEKKDEANVSSKDSSQAGAAASKSTDKNTQDKKEPVKISTWEQFVHIGDTSYDPAYTMDADYILVSKIASDGKDFTPIGTKENPFCGTFDGQDYPIDLRKNPEIKTDSSYGGLFGVVKEPEKNE